jgi:hypothetical protein
MKSSVLLIALTTTVFALGAKAQTETTFGVRAGLNFTNFSGKDQAGNKLDEKIKAGINIGINVEIPIASNTYVQPGLLFTTKGAKDKVYRKVSYNLSYLEIPVNLLFKPELGDGKLLLGVGPYLAFAVGGSYKDPAGNKTDFTFANKRKDGSPYAKRMDLGGNLLAGYELSSRLSFQLNAQLGFLNVIPRYTGVADKSNFHNTGFGVSAGYRF